MTFTATATDVDLPANTLTFSLSGTVPTGAFIDPTTGAFSWTPSETQGPGDHTFSVKVCDDGTPALCDQEEITITVNEVNVAPVITEGTSVPVTMSEDGVPTAFSLTLNATDVDLPANLLTWSISTPASNGAASASGTGLSKVIGYTPTSQLQRPGQFCSPGFRWQFERYDHG